MGNAAYSLMVVLKYDRKNFSFKNKLIKEESLEEDAEPSPLDRQLRQQKIA